METDWSLKGFQQILSIGEQNTHGDSNTAPSTKETPNVAFILSVIGGILVFIGGLVEIALGAFLSSLFSNLNVRPIVLLFQIWKILGFVGMVWGALIMVGAVMLLIKPDQHTIWGVFVVVFSILSWFGGFAGFIIGFILALVGGILGITWKPSTFQFQPAPISSSSYVPYPPLAPTTRVCPTCGNGVEPSARFCTYCGKSI